MALSVLGLLIALFAEEPTTVTTHTYPLPHLATGWQNYLLVDHVGTTTAAFHITLFDGEGRCVFSDTVTVEAGHFQRLDPRELASTAESGSIATDEPRLHFRLTYVEPSQKGTAEFALNTETDRVLQFNLGAYPSEVVPLTWKGLALMNTGEATTTVHLYALDASGRILAETQQTVAAKQRFRDTVNGLFEGLPDTSAVRIVASADQPLSGLNIAGNEFRQLLFSTARSGGTVPVPTAAEKPNTLPAFAGLRLYRDTSPLNQAIAPDARIDPESAALIAGMADAGDLVVQVGQYSAPVFFADAATPRISVALACGTPWELGVTSLENVPMPPWAEAAEDIDGGDNPPIGCGEDSDQDNHLVILDLIQRCEYTFWQARRDQDGGWTASYAAALSMDGDGIFPNGMSSRGSGFSFLGGLIWPDELRNGRINHALVFSYPFVRSGGPVEPATDSDGVSDLPFAIPEGARLQLDPTLDLDSLNLTAYEKTIARALQEFGMFLVDQGGSSGIGLYAVDPRSTTGNPYDGLWPSEDYVALPNIPFNAFRVLTMGDQNADYRVDLRLPENGCVSYR